MTAGAVWAALGLLVGALLATSTRWLMTSPPKTPLLSVSTAGATSVLFGLAISRTPPLPEQLAYSVFAAIGVQLAAIDLVNMRLPKALIWPTSGVLLALLATSAAHGGTFMPLIRATTGAAVLVAFYLAIAVASRGGMGAGDVRLAAPVGLMLAWHSWTTLVIGTAIGFVCSLGLMAVMTAAHPGRGRSPIPHGPAMLAGAFVVMIV